MDVELTVPQTPVALEPGTETRVPVEVSNRSIGAISVRLSVVPSRAGGWAHLEPATLDLAAGDSAAGHVVFRTPANALPSSNLLPFTVRADDLRSGLPAGRATGLLTVAAPERIDATLIEESVRGRRVTLQLRLVNRTEAPLTVKLEPRLDPPGKRVEAEPAVVDVPVSGTATARLKARPRARLVGSTEPYAVVVDCRDAAAGADAEPLATVEQTGKVKARIGRRPATVLVAVILLLATAGGVLVGRVVDLPWRGRPSLNPPGRSVAPVTRPYALVDVFPRREGLPAAQDAYNRLTATGMPLKLIDSTTSDEVADEPDGLWVLLSDGFTSADEANAFCDRYRSIAPKCQVIP